MCVKLNVGVVVVVVVNCGQEKHVVSMRKLGVKKGVFV